MPDGEEEITLALTARVRAAISLAQATAAQSEVLRTASRIARERETMVRRCAWCGRLALGDGWTSPEAAPEFLRACVSERATHGICPACVRRLERSGRSRAGRAG